MKYIFFTFDGFAFPIAYHLLREGHDVTIGQVISQEATLTPEELKTYPKEEAFWKKRRLRLYNNILKRIPADILIKKMKKIKNPEDYFVFFDHNRLFRYADQIRDLGFHGNFPTQEDYLFETDRNMAKEFVKKYYPQVKITPKKEFKKVHDAKDFLKKSRHLWVIKGYEKDAPTFVPSSNDPATANQQLIDVMNNFKVLYEESGFILERKISSLIEITPEKIYYNGTPINLMLNFENKTIGAGNLGFQTMCAGDLIIPIDFANAINDIAFPPIVDTLAKQHKGLFMWDASLLIDTTTGEIFFGEFCPNRAWYNSFYTYLELVPSTAYFFETIVSGKNPFRLGTVGASVTLFNLLTDAKNSILSDIATNFDSQELTHIWPFDIYGKSQDKKHFLSGWDIYVAPVTGKGKTIKQAVTNAYMSAASFSFPSIYYRPQFDFVSRDYSTSILNRLSYGIKNKLYTLPFSDPLTV